MPNYSYPDTEILTELTGDIKTQLDKMASQQPMKIACYGNSITYGSRGDNYMQAIPAYPEALEQMLRLHYNNTNINVVNEGHPGWTAAQGLQYADSLVIANAPQICTIEFGINDVVQNVKKEDFEQSLTDLCRKLKAANIKVVLLSPTPILLSKNIGLIEFCKSVQAVANREQVGFINMHYRIVQRMINDKRDPTVLLPDQVHFNNDGYKLISEEITKYWYSL